MVYSCMFTICFVEISNCVIESYLTDYVHSGNGKQGKLKSEKGGLKWDKKYDNFVNCSESIRQVWSKAKIALIRCLANYRFYC